MNIEEYEDQCAFVELACHGFSGMYLKLYYCSPLWKPITVSVMVNDSSFLFSLFLLTNSWILFCWGGHEAIWNIEL